jgi:hypothetical protein
VLDPMTELRRKDIALDAADKDGGAHVDAKLTPAYERLIADSTESGFFSSDKAGDRTIGGHHYVALRQLGCEILNSQI